ncbi:ATP-binding protein [Streptacidiphilus sp. N1-12]|uniref:ATP-binding protein n=2 Tax=Streptacidiphilus alkalitolerans TaxID=3342712 RepID=A0ABV6XBY0_9ACTN
MDQHPPPVHTTLRLDGTAGSTTAARLHTEEFLARLRPSLPPLTTQDAVLAVSELVANAVRHAPGPCALDLLHHGHLLVIAVTDTSAVVPATREPDLVNGTGGFGMHLLARLAAETTVRAQSDGKTITVTLHIPA